MEEEEKGICEYAGCKEKATHKLMWGSTIIAEYCKGCAKMIKHRLLSDHIPPPYGPDYVNKDKWGARKEAPVCKKRDHVLYSLKYRFCPACGKDLEVHMIGRRGRSR